MNDAKLDALIESNTLLSEAVRLLTLVLHEVLADSGDQEEEHGDGVERYMNGNPIE